MLYYAQYSSDFSSANRAQIQPCMKNKGQEEKKGRRNF